MNENVDPKKEKKYKVIQESDRKVIENRINDLYKKDWVLIGNVRFHGHNKSKKFTATLVNRNI